jgi:NAD(P)-dependent dehydrogenase (short-subunit alcohol dehydrogenase family)
LFAREGAKMFAVDVRSEAVRETKQIIENENGICIWHQADVSHADEVKAVVDRCMDSYGRIDVLHNNVGILEVGGPVEISGGQLGPTF